MTDPHDAAFDLNDNTTYSDTPETTFQSPAISISPSEAYGRRVSATNQAIAFSSSHIAPSSTAYDAGTPSNHSFGYTNGYPRFLPSHTDDTAPKPTTNAASVSLNLATLGSQPWISPSVPYLHFAPQPVYEPTGELINEKTANFHEFDNPTIVRSISDSNSESPQETHPATSSSLPQTTKAVNAFVPPAPPRSVLKRKADSLESPVSSDGKKNERPVNKTRSVSFERMSGRGPGSPDETQSTLDKQPAQARSSAGPSQPGRKSRQAAASSTPKPGPTPLPQSTPGEAQTHRGSFRGGTRHPSGHPPSILPPEKVFPIQIGSDLFRLSGASISSDGEPFVSKVERFS
jgi:hypothetical protein